MIYSGKQKTRLLKKYGIKKRQITALALVWFKVQMELSIPVKKKEAIDNATELIILACEENKKK